MTQSDARFTKVVPLRAEEIPLSLRALDGHECDFIADAFNEAWSRIPAHDRAALAAFWRATPESGTSGVASPCVMSWHPGSHGTSLGVNSAGVSMYFDPVILRLVRADANGQELVTTAIAHELAHSLHIARGLHLKKTMDQVESEIDEMTASWGFTGDVRRWIDEHFRVG
ncbi:MAG: hypothetical protein JSR77_05700 [Planctomycetes bacterium]|nr:hypothetical protein [Planctomycetota bacterium]